LSILRPGRSSTADLIRPAVEDEYAWSVKARWELPALQYGASDDVDEAVSAALQAYKWIVEDLLNLLIPNPVNSDIDESDLVWPGFPRR